MSSIKLDSGSTFCSKSRNGHISFMYFGILISCVLSISVEASFQFDSGKYFVINSVANKKVITVSGSSFSRDSPIVTSLWTSTDSQKWLALEASSSGRSPNGRVVSGPQKFILISKTQKWSWDLFKVNGTVSLPTLETLPENTVVLSLDNSVGNLTQEMYDEESSSQKWVTEDTDDDYVVIRNWGNQQCIKNFDYKPMNIFQVWSKRIRNFFGPHKKKTPYPLGTLTCSTKDISQKWMLELI